MKNLLSSAVRKLKTAIVIAADVSLRVIGIVSAIIALIVLSVKSPEIHGHWLRQKVGSKVYIISDKLGGGGGTGFAVMAPSGRSYILTNDHVCGISKDGRSVLVSNEEGLSIRRAIVARSEYTDLCLVESVPGVEGLKVGEEPDIGQIVASIGHPSLMPITLSRGEIIGAEDVVIPIGLISISLPNGERAQVPPSEGGILPEDCMLPKHQQIDVMVGVSIFVLPGTVCATVTKKAYRTNMQIQPGSSGSPVVNFFGNIVGVVFAGDRASWAGVVSYRDVVRFLKYY